MLDDDKAHRVEDLGRPPGSPEVSVATELSELRDEVARLRVELDELRSTGDPHPLRSEGVGDDAGPGGDVSGTAEAAPPDELTDRRTLLRRAGAVAAGAVAGGTALAMAQASPAAAADGEALTLGEVRISNSETELRYSGGTLTGDHILFVQDASSSAASSFPSAIAGYSLNGRVPHGVLGHTQNPGAGVVGSGSGPESIAGHFITGSSSKATLRLGTSGPAPQLRNSNGSYQAGDVVGAATDDLWLCVASGASGSSAGWRKLGGPATAGQLHVLPGTIRCYDSRPGQQPLVGIKAPLLGGQIRTIDVKANGTNVPGNATAVMVNVTVTNTSAAGFLGLFRGDIGWPGNSTVNWDHLGTNTADSTVVALAPGGFIHARVGGVQTDFLIDVIGFYA